MSHSVSRWNLVTWWDWSGVDIIEQLPLQRVFPLPHLLPRLARVLLSSLYTSVDLAPTSSFSLHPVPTSGPTGPKTASVGTENIPKE